jgi:outer membrane lipoprotein-sorting protein
LFLKAFLFFFIFFNFSLNLHANEKQLIINQLLKIKNFTFNFEQIKEGKKETGDCFLVFDNKLKCKYIGEKQKEIIINKKTLVVMHKKYDKIYFYPISNSPFAKLLSKKSLVRLVRESKLELKDNITLVYLDKNKKKITVFFKKDNHELIGWQIKDEFQNKIAFLLQIQSVNTQIEDDLFKIPSIN